MHNNIHDQAKREIQAGLLSKMLNIESVLDELREYMDEHEPSGADLDIYAEILDAAADAEADWTLSQSPDLLGPVAARA